MKSSRFHEAIERFDAINSQDPNQVVCEQSGELIAKELRDARAMTAIVESLYPEAPEAVLLAARSQHIARWKIPRDEYPKGRAGYHNWRNALKELHAKMTRNILGQLGYSEEILEQVEKINLKKGIKRDPEVQMVEDALCLVFLKYHFEDYIDKWEESKIIRILRKTWPKMSELGQVEAAKLDLSDKARALVCSALSETKLATSPN